MGKGRKEQTRIKRAFSAGSVVFKKEKGMTLWLVTLSSPSKKFPNSVWRLPKGTVDKEESLEETAPRETMEEGGVAAKIIKKIGTEKYFATFDGQKYLKFVTFYLMRWENDLPRGFDFETSAVAWLPFDEAYKKLSYSGEKLVLKKARELL